MNNKVGAIWARVSTNAQKDLSPDSQVERVRTMLEGLGISVPPENVFKVVWTSTDLKPCPDFQRLLSLVRKREIGTIGMLDRDRIEAQGLQRLNFIANCKENGVELIVYQGPPFLEGAEGQLVELALALAKEKQVDRAQSGAKQGLADRARLRDLPPTIAKVYGMQWDKEKRKFLSDSNYDNACLIFGLWFGSQKLDRIGAELLQRVILTPRGRREWSSSSISAILKNPVYAGRVATLKYERREPVVRRRATFGKTSAKLRPESEWHWLPDGSVERPIITWDQHLAIIERLKLNELNASRNAKHDYLLRGRIECQLCGRRYFAVAQKKNGKPRYYCSKHYAYAGMDKCPAQPLDMEELHLGVIRRLKWIADRHAVHMEDGDYEKLFEELTGIKTSTRVELEKQIEDYRSQRQKTVNDELRYADMLTPEAFKSKQASLKDRRAWLEDEISQTEKELGTLRTRSIDKAAFEHIIDGLIADGWGELALKHIFEAIDLRVLAHGDGTWVLQVSLPQEPIANNTPWSTSPCRRPEPRRLRGGGVRCAPRLARSPGQRGKWPGRDPDE